MTLSLHSRPTLTGRLLLAILTIVMLIFGLTAWVNYLYESHKAHQLLEHKADEQIANLSRSLELPLWSLDHNLVQAIARAYLQNEQIVAIRITEADQLSEIFVEQKEFSGPPILRSATIRFEGEVLGQVDLTLNSNLLQEQLTDLLRYSIGTALLTALVLSLLTGYLMRRLLKQPLRNLQEGMERLASGDYAEPLEVELAELRPISAAFTDMSRQVEAREQELQRLVDASWEAILIHDQGTLLHANEQFFELFSQDPRQLVGKPCIESIIAPDELEQVLERIRTDDPGPYETLGRNSAGEIFPIEVRARQLKQKGQFMRMVAIRDLRERKQLEEMMIQSEKMISVGGLAAGMAHEINNPLAGILQSIQVINNRLNPGLEKNRKVAEDAGTEIEKINRYLEQRDLSGMFENIRLSGVRAAKIVENILSFSRKSGAQMMPVDMPQLIEETLVLAESDYDLKKQFDFRKVKITREFSPELPAVYCEASQIQQVLFNLLKNGAHAMSAAGTQDPHFILRCRVDTDAALLEIEDNGPGMDKETCQRVFEPFFTTKKVGEGTGLGLSVSYFIVTETHGGEMSVASSDKGTVFSIRLPLSPARSNIQ